MLGKIITDEKFEKYRYPWKKETIESVSEASIIFVRVMLQQGQKAEQAQIAGKHFVETNFPNESIWYDIEKESIDNLRVICQSGYEGKGYATRYNFAKFPKWIKSNAEIMTKKYDGDPRNIWDVPEKYVEEIYKRFKKFHGIGDALAKMAQFILVRRYAVVGGIKSKQHLKVKPDIHICRVLYSRP